MEASGDLSVVKEIPSALDAEKKTKGPLAHTRMIFGAGEGI
jgi:hypothetical protein